MTSDAVSKGPIVCATRGGEVTRRTQERAVEIAREQDSALVFFFAADISFARVNNPELAEALTDELVRFGRTLLYIAQSRARRRDVDAQAEVRVGVISHVLEDFLREVDASTLVLGAPNIDTSHHAFGPDELPRFAQEIRDSTGVEVVIVT